MARIWHSVTWSEQQGISDETVHNVCKRRRTFDIHMNEQNDRVEHSGGEGDGDEVGDYFSPLDSVVAFPRWST